MFIFKNDDIHAEWELFTLNTKRFMTKRSSLF